MEYNFLDIEKKWQQYWEENKTFRTEFDPGKPKYYVLDMFPYPSGSGLHVGHPEGYTATDIVSRYKRMKGFNVLHPMGWDAFGLPAEQYAIQTGTHPATTTQENCATFRRQIKELGLSYDWDREINTTDPEYYKWTQWIFIRLYQTWFDRIRQKGRPISELNIPEEIAAQGDVAVRKYIDSNRLAYYDNAQVWWCNTCKIVCANEEVLSDGSHEKCGTREVIRKNLKQWMLRIPLYAERLLSGLDTLTEWPESVKDMQRNWIGKSTGAEVDFEIEGLNRCLRVFTTRPDTLFGATYMVIAPEHNLLSEIVTSENAAKVQQYVKAASLKSDLDRTELAKEKTGVFTGRNAINPVNGQKIPIWVADYVLIGYGTGAIMAVPAHDTRDFEFAEKYNIEIRCILDPESAETDLRQNVLAGKACWTEDGKYINSSGLDGLNINGLNKQRGIETVIEWLEEHGRGNKSVNYKLRDWLFSRQRYWGEPFPIKHYENGSIELIDERDLPIELPDLKKYEPGVNGESPLSNAGDWLYGEDKKGKFRRETNTMPQWAGSCWYYLRYIDPKNDKAPFDPEKEKYWMPVDLYIGGAEHAVLHLLYSRFWHKVLFDLGIVSTDEPYLKLFNQGMILAFAYETSSGSKVPSDEVEERDGRFYHKVSGDELVQIVAKMSKTLKNVVNPDDVIQKYGADSLRLYEMFMGPLDATKPWTDTGVKGVFNFLRRVYVFFAEIKNVYDGKEDEEVMKLLHQSIQKISSDIENLKFNTAISQLMILNNLIYKKGKISRDAARIFAKLLSPFAPHMGEELWQLYGGKETIAYELWPKVDEKYLQEDVFEYPVSFNGKLRFKIALPVTSSKSEIEEAVLKHEKALKWTENKEIRKVIIVPNKIVNIVISG
jgi:leucyl-tRNA synthetase